ncbi:hypothetical protein [Streptomyces sp. NPDC051016]|uniref:hypothetical protein n=1 Tax=Streptomyces sp. NPDC051016 TaxID=3365638 RepID=UPI003798D3F9
MNRSPARLGDLLRTARALGVSDPAGLTALAAALGLALPSDGPARRTPAPAPARPSRGGTGTGTGGGRGRGDTAGRASRPGSDAPPGPGPYDRPPTPPGTAPATPPGQVPGPDTGSATGGSLLLIRAARPAPDRETEQPLWRDPEPPDRSDAPDDPHSTDPADTPDPADPAGPTDPTDSTGQTHSAGQSDSAGQTHSAGQSDSTDPIRPTNNATAELLGHTAAFDLPGPSALPRPASPWNPRTERAVFLAMAGTLTTGRAVDRHRLVELVVRSLAGGPIARPRVPYRQRTTTRAGALLLIDRGESMRPFRHDQEWITRLAARILPPGGLRVLDLRIAQGISRDRGRTWEPHPVPPYGQPVLLLSDLGHLQPPSPGRHHSSPASWLSYLRRLRETGTPVVCLTPYPAEEYPAAVRETVALVPLDRRVSVRLAQTATRRDPRRAGRRR